MSMLAPLIILYLVLLCGCFFGCAYFRRRFEEMLPLWCITIVLAMFLFGITGLLKAGAYFILPLALAAFIAGALRLKKMGAGDFRSRFLSPGFWLFALLYVALILFNRGRLLLAWDDYTHWGDVVKVMITMDVMSTSPLSSSLFQEYPPALALFEYLLQKLIVLFGGKFTEWPLFFSYQILFFSLLFPFFGRLDFRKPYSYIIAALLFLSPLPFYREVMSQLMVDPFLGMAFGCALGHLFLNRASRYGRCAVLMYAALLVLVKSSGLLFAALLALGFVLTIPGELSRRGKAAQVGSVVLAVLLPKLLWELNIKINHASYTFNLAGDLASHSGGDYRVEAAKAYILGFFNTGITDAEAWFPPVPPFLLTLLIAVGMYFICRRLIALFPQRRRNYIILGVLMVVGICVYIIGLGITYLFSFADWEALELASYGRYLGSVFFAMELLLLLLSAELIRLGAVDRAKLVSLILCIEAVLIPWNSVVYFLSRSNVEYSINRRQDFAPEVDAVEALPDGKQRIYTVCCDSEYFILRYLFRPDMVNPPDTWWATGTPAATSVQEWREQLAGEYDYVLLHTVADSFYTDFAEAFVPGTEIVTGQLYTVDPESGLLSPAG